MFYCNEEMDALLTAAASSADPEERALLYQQIGDLYAEEVPTLPLFWEPEYITYRDGVEGIQIASTIEFNYNVLSFSADAKPASGKTDTIIIGTTDEVHSLDPDDAYAVHDWEIIRNTGRPLLAFAPGTTELGLGVAAEMPAISEDGKVYTFKLREGVTYADGTPLTANDFVYSWERINSLEGEVSGLVQVYVESVVALDDLTVQYTSRTPTGSSRRWRPRRRSCRPTPTSLVPTPWSPSRKRSMAWAPTAWSRTSRVSRWCWPPTPTTTGKTRPSSRT